MSICLEAGLTKRLLKELGHLKSHAEELSAFFFLEKQNKCQLEFFSKINKHMQLQTCPQT
jgi:hypothetical protein